MSQLRASDMANPDPPPDRGCAVRSDGTLKDASEIDWSFDKSDDETPPLSGPSSTSRESRLSSGPTRIYPPSTSLPSAGPTQIHPFFSSTPVAAGYRRSGRATRPSNRVIDPDNAMGVASGKGKRTAPGQMSSRNVKQRVIQEDDELSEQDLQEQQDSNDEQDYNAPTEVSTDVDEDDTDAVQRYESLKAMADADHKVSTLVSCTLYHNAHCGSHRHTFIGNPYDKI